MKTQTMAKHIVITTIEMDNLYRAAKEAHEQYLTDLQLLATKQKSSSTHVHNGLIVVQPPGTKEEFTDKVLKDMSEHGTIHLVEGGSVIKEVAANYKKPKAYRHKESDKPVSYLK